MPKTECYVDIIINVTLTKEFEPRCTTFHSWGRRLVPESLVPEVQAV